MPEKKKSTESPIAMRIKSLRESLGLNQTEFAARLHAMPSAVSKWEAGRNRPSPEVFVGLAKLSEGAEKLFFLELAGVPESFFYGRPMLPEMLQASSEVIAKALPHTSDRQASEVIIQVPLLKDSVAAGIPRNIEERDIEGYIPILRWWVPRNARLCALHIVGDSMSPIIEDGYIVIVNLNEHDPKSLVGRMVVARGDDGVTIKWLRRDKNIYMLVPQHVSLRHPVTVIGPNHEFDIAGTVVRWIGQPPPSRK